MITIFPFHNKRHAVCGSRNLLFFCFVSLLLLSCSGKNNPGHFKLVTLDPGHFHAALVQKSMYEAVDSTVYIYAPESPDLELHLERINGFNTRPDDPTHWNEVVYQGNDFFHQMIREKKGNVVVLSGNNQKKSEYILGSLENGFHVLADKPMAIDREGYQSILKAFVIAKKNKLQLYDIMTERYEITTQIQRELSMLPAVFGQLEKGSPENPAITKESVHHFYKYVAGSALTRPSWFLDASQQGEGMVDVMTHLVDLVQWECFPGQAIDTSAIHIVSSLRWPTQLSLPEFSAITRLKQFPTFLESNIGADSLLAVFSNGEINYTINGVHAKTAVTWNYRAPEGTGDTHYSMMRGSLANLVIRQGPEEQYLPTLYIEPVTRDSAYAGQLEKNLSSIFTKYPGVELYKSDKGWKLKLPSDLREGHEAHFARVMEKYLEYLANNNMPDWEVPNMIAKYYTTTAALNEAKTLTHR